MKKQLIWYDPHTHKPEVWATMELKGGKVIFEPKDAVEKHGMLRELTAAGNKRVNPNDGEEYWKALDRLRGSYYEVKEVK